MVLLALPALQPLVVLLALAALQPLVMLLALSFQVVQAEGE